MVRTTQATTQSSFGSESLVHGGRAGVQGEDSKNTSEGAEYRAEYPVECSPLRPRQGSLPRGIDA
eukprot:428872-Prorocentrum_minimum.AAC.1